MKLKDLIKEEAQTAIKEILDENYGDPPPSLHRGDEVYWEDPDGGVSSGVYTVMDTHGEDIVTLRGEDGQEVEAFRHELDWSGGEGEEAFDADLSYPGEDMDGDFDSGMASAGFGTDEDYDF